MAEPAMLFPDKKFPSAIRVEWINDDGGCEVAIFDGPRALDRATQFAAAFYGTYVNRVVS